MKQILRPKQILQQKHSFHNAMKSSLSILEMNTETLSNYLSTLLDPNFARISSSAFEEDKLAYLANQTTQGPSLSDVIFEQLHLLSVAFEEDVCIYFLLQLDRNGYFRQSKQDLFRHYPASKAILEAHLTLLRSLEPKGCFAFSLADCLKLQCQEEKPEARYAYRLCDHLEWIAAKKFDLLQKETKMTASQIQQGIGYLQTLHPKPAAPYGGTTVFMQAEFKIEKTNDQLTIHPLYHDFTLEMEEWDQETLIAYRKQANQLLNMVQKRNLTLTQVMQVILDIQKDFFLFQQPLRPLTLEMIAQQCGIHISTVSRAISNKMCEFEQNYYPLSSFLTTGSKIGHSPEEVKDKIKKIIALEDTNRPYSDARLQSILKKEDNIVIARRTITKYREACQIPNSSERKKANTSS